MWKATPQMWCQTQCSGCTAQNHSMLNLFKFATL
jgi:hypothetical protein